MKYVNSWQQKNGKDHGFRNLIVSLLAGSAVIALLTVVFAVLLIFQSYRFWLQSPGEGAVVETFTVEDGSSLKQVAEDLEEQDLIASSFWFRAYTALDGSARFIQAGDFDLAPGASYASVVDVITAGQGGETQVTIPEGFTLVQIGDRTVSSLNISLEDWNIATGIFSPYSDHEFILSAGKPGDVDLEGYLFPDTYRFFDDANAEDVVITLLDEMQSRVKGAGIEPPPGWTMHDVLTLASIIEREVPDPSDMAMIADIFLKRLEIGMALQSDATINYITGKDDPTPSSDDLSVNSLYNTYQYPGLPPGPIASPGIEAIKAVVNPTPNSYYYYLTSPEGEVIYSVTHDEHVANKAKYLY